MEGSAVEKSLPFLTEVDKSQLISILIEMEEMKISDATNDQYIQLNAAFHETLRKGCPWPKLNPICSLIITPKRSRSTG
jgi:DNA-binding GntR family transcriptional regulator